MERLARIMYKRTVEEKYERMPFGGDFVAKSFVYSICVIRHVCIFFHHSDMKNTI